MEGFDFGIGILLPILGRDEARRNAMLRTIGPVWDGNEVWLITAGGALFAAFPEWYATMFSGFYLPLFLILLALIVRIVGLEWRKKVDDPVWRRRCDAAIIAGSWLPPILWGVAVANLVRGVPLDADHGMSSGPDVLLGLLNPYALLGGAALTAVFTNPTGLWSGLGLIVVATVLPYLLYTKGLEGVESGKASIMANVEPVVGALVGVFVFGETLSVWVILGVVCMLCGVMLLAKE